MKTQITSSAVAAVLTALVLTPVSAAAQAQGQQQAVPQTRPLGLTQDAWNARLRTRGESRVNPGYVRYVYNPANVFPIRTRESMITTIKIPEGEELTQAFTGDDQGFLVGIATPNSIAVKAVYPGVDTNLVAFTREGKVYTFYVRSEGYNSKTISDFLVDVVMPGAGVIEGGSMTSEAQALSQIRQDEMFPARAAERVRDPYSSLVPDRREQYREYAEWSDFKPGTVVEDIGVYVPQKEAGGTIPYRVFRDDRFTYVDYGPNATQMTEWPTPLIVVQGVEGPVGFRTAGPGGRMLVMEALGNFILRNGQRMIVVKPRSEPHVDEKNNVLIEYPVASSGSMRVPTDLPAGRPGALISDPRTVVPTNGPRTVHGEAPSAVVSLPTERKIERSGSRDARRGVLAATAVREIPAPAPAAPIRTVVGTTGAIDAAGVAMGARPTVPVPKPVPTAPTKAVPTTIVPTSPAPAAGPAGVLRPATDASGLGSYKVVMGKGDRATLEDRWKSLKVQHYAALSGKDMAVEESGGASAMAISPVATIADGMRLCTLMGSEVSNCTVKPVRPAR